MSQDIHSSTYRVVATYGHTSLVQPIADSASNLATPALLPAVRRGRRTDVVVGDIVSGALAHDQLAIESIQPRRSLLYRADAVRTKELAANIDQVAIVFAPQPPPNPHFLWRALVAANAAQVKALVVLNKTDIENGSSFARALLDGAEQLGVKTLALAAKAQPEQSLAALIPQLASQATLFVGQSGMGKSTLTNLLVPHANAHTQEYSQRLNVGKQTTTASRWFDLPAEHGGGALIDTPGFQAFGLAHLSLVERAAAMADFSSYLGHCRFSDCRHLREPGCAIRLAVDEGFIQPQRYLFWQQLTQEVSR